MSKTAGTKLVLEGARGPLQYRRRDVSSQATSDMLQVCTLLSGLVVQSMVLSEAPGAGSQAAGVGSAYRMLLRKRLGSAELGECRSGVVALRCLVSRLAREETQARPLKLLPSTGPTYCLYSQMRCIETSSSL